MCFHVAAKTDLINLQKQLQVKASPLVLHQTYHHVSAFSFPALTILTSEAPDILQSCQWGLIPFWTQDDRKAQEIKAMTLNAKAETIYEKASFKASVKYKRCIIPVTGFFEWRSYQDKKYPYFVSTNSQENMLLAGVYDYWTSQTTGEIYFTFSIVTTAANRFMQQIHNTKNRMPLILSENQRTQWLDTRTDTFTIQRMMKPQADGHLKAHTVSKLITSRTQDSNVPEVIHPYTYNELPPLHV